VILSLVSIAAAAVPASASFHAFGVNEVYSDPSGNVQFIELHERFGTDFEGFFTGISIVSNAHTYTFQTDLPSQSTANKFVLLGTADYAAIPGVPAPNFTIPASFFNPAGDTLTYGGFADTITFGAVPANPLQSLNRSGDTMIPASATPTDFAGDSGSVPEPTGVAVLAVAGVLLVRRRRVR
jgi:MYXO-CTERM domain-containing protein